MNLNDSIDLMKNIIITAVIIGTIAGLTVKCFKYLLKPKIKNNKTKNISYNNDKLIKNRINNDILPYRKKHLVSNREFIFYNELKMIARKLNLCILCKIRVADLVEVYGTNNNSEYYKYFGKIKSKHIDFALANQENLDIILLIEIDDSSHDKKDRKERDEFVNSVYEKCGYKILHIRDTILLEEKIKNKIIEN